MITSILIQRGYYGENSLIKSTSKKKKTPEKDDATKTVAQKKSAVISKAAPSPAKAPTKKPKKETAQKTQKEVAKPSSAQNTDTQKSPPPPKSKPAGEPKPAIEPKPVKEPTPVEETKSPTITYETPLPPATKEPIDKTLLIGAGCILFLFILIIGASMTNTSNYYIKEMPVGIEIWQGEFAPLGEKKIFTLPGIDAPKIKKVVYNKHDVNPLIFKHYIDKADALLIRPGIPDYQSIKTHLIQSQNYAINTEMTHAASRRLVAIDFNALLYRANVAASRKTVEGMEKSLDYLSQAGQLKLEPGQMDQVVAQQGRVKKILAGLQDAQNEGQ